MEKEKGCHEESPGKTCKRKRKEGTETDLEVRIVHASKMRYNVAFNPILVLSKVGGREGGKEGGRGKEGGAEVKKDGDKSR